MNKILVLVSLLIFIFSLSVTFVYSQECTVKNAILKTEKEEYDCSENLTSILTFDYPPQPIDYTIEWHLYNPKNKQIVEKKEENRVVVNGIKGTWTVIAMPYDYGWKEKGSYRLNLKLKGKCNDNYFEKDFETIFNVKNSCIEHLKTLTVYEGDLVNLKIIAEDPDNDKLTYKYSKPFSNKGVWQTTYNDAGNYTVSVQVSDGELVTSAKFLLVVLNKNQAPVIDIEDKITVEEEETVFLKPRIFDPDGDNVTTLVTGWMSSFEKKTTLNDAGVYDVVIIATDGDLQTRKTVKVEVINKNQKPVLKISDTKTVEGEVFTLEPVVFDPDNDKINIKVTGWMTNLSKYVDYNEQGEHEVTIIASDGKEEVEKTIIVKVLDNNRLPDCQKIQNQNINENETLIIPLKAIDLDQDKVEFNLLTEDEDYLIENDKFIWHIGFDYLKQGKVTKEVKISCSDGKGQSILKFNVTIFDKNRPPIILDYTPKKDTFFLDKPINFTVSAYDPDGDTLTYTWKFGLQEKYDETNNLGKSSHLRKFTEPGTKIVKVIVSDGKDETYKYYEVHLKQLAKKQIEYSNVKGKIVVYDTQKQFVIDNKEEKKEENNKIEVLADEKKYVIDNEQATEEIEKIYIIE